MRELRLTKFKELAEIFFETLRKSVRARADYSAICSFANLVGVDHDEVAQKEENSAESSTEVSAIVKRFELGIRKPVSNQVDIGDTNRRSAIDRESEDTSSSLDDLGGLTAVTSLQKRVACEDDASFLIGIGAE